MSRPSEAKAARRRKRRARGKTRGISQREHLDRVGFGANALHTLCNRAGPPLKNGGRKKPSMGDFTDMIADAMGLNK